MEEQKMLKYEEADVRFLCDANNQHIILSSGLSSSKNSFLRIVVRSFGFMVVLLMFIEGLKSLIFELFILRENPIAIFGSLFVVLLLGGILSFYLSSIYKALFFRNGYIIQNQEELVFLYKPYYRFLDRKGKYRKVIQREDITQFIIDGSFGDICAVKGDEKISIISNYYTVNYTKEEGGDTTKKIHIGMEEPLAEKICFKLNEFWGFDTTPPIADEQKNELKADSPFLDDIA